MKLLALETAGPWCSAALMVDEQIEQRLEEAPRRHADRILAMLEELLRAAGLGLCELDAIVYGRGPGSFTGVRIAAAVTQGIAFGSGRGVVGISTLAATAQAAYRQCGQTRLACALDARMGEVYWGCYEIEPVQQRLRLVGEECVIAPERSPLLPQPGWCAVGDGWSRYAALRARHQQSLDDRWEMIRAEARDLLVLAKHELEDAPPDEPPDALPVYLRNRVASIPTRPLDSSAGSAAASAHDADNGDAYRQ